MLGAAGREQWAEAATLACTEIVSNVVLHAHTDLELTVEVFEEAVRVQVRDFNPALPVQRDYGEQALTGRGMALVAALATEHGIDDVGPDGKTVWFTVAGDLTEQTDEQLLNAWDDASWDLGDLLGGSPLHPAQEVRTVHLPDLPPVLWLAAREHHDALVRELGLHLAQHGPGDLEVDVAATDRARSTVSCAVLEAVERAQRSGAAQRARPTGGSVPLPDVPGRLDVELQVPADLVPAYPVMQKTLDAAERLAAAGLLLSRPGLPEIVAVRDWVCEQVTAQASGAPAVAWPGADLDRYTADRTVPAQSVDGDVAFVRDSPRNVVAADDSNRIVAVSRSLAAALGWTVDDLVGRRVVTLIPHRFREAHVAGFTRHQTTGEAHVLGVPLTVPVLRTDGTEVTARLLLETAPTAAGRAVYLAWLEPLDPG